MGRGLLNLAIAVACYTAQDLASARCDTYCKRSGYDYGFHDDKKEVCACVDELNWEATLAKRTVIHSKKVRVSARKEEVPREHEEVPTWVDQGLWN